MFCLNALSPRRLIAARAQSQRSKLASAFRSIAILSLLIASVFLPVSSASAKSSMQMYVEAMQPGWNLGNTLDAIPDETSWGNPLVTQALIQQIAAQGYKSIRIPITWTAHTGAAPGYTIDPAWMDRVQQIVDWSLQSGMYVLINTHHDSWQWISAMPTDHDAVVAQYTAVWTQISTRFANYSNKLMFESINEPQFAVDDATAMTLLDDLNTRFVNIVRASGGANATRPLVLPSLHTNSAQNIIDSLSATMAHLNDPNLIATIHYYGWWPFSVNIAGDTKFNDPASIGDVNTSFDNVYNTFVAKGIPVIVGEFGVLETGNDAVERGEFLKYFEYVTQYARAKGLTHMIWDAGQDFDRTTFQWKDPELFAILKQTLTGRATNAESDLLFIKSGAPVQDTGINLNLNGNNFVSLQDGSTTLVAGKDYTLNGSLLTVKASELAKYASGAFGEKTVLAVNVNSGPSWKIHVRYYSTPVVSPTVGTNTGTFAIPTAFNGDLLSTLEARYTNGMDAGPTNWTPYQQFNYAFSPDYAHNAVVLANNFLPGMPTGTINVALHFWSGQIVNYQLTLQAKASGSGSDYVIYDDALASGWNNWSSWAANNLADTTQVHAGSAAISVTPGGWGGFVLQNGGPAMDTSGYHTLVFWINGGPTGGQSIGIGPIQGSVWGPGSTGLPALQANTWQKVEIPLSSLGVDGSAGITGFYFQNWTGTDAPTFYIDDIHLSPVQSSSALDVIGTVPTASTLTMTKGGFTLNRRTNQMVQSVTITNPTDSAVTGPTYLILDALSWNTTLANANGSTQYVVPSASPYILVSNGTLAPHQSLTVSLAFTVPSSGGITYNARLLSGSSSL